MKFNKFLETVSLSQVFASVVNNEFWSIVVFYKEGAATERSFAANRNFLKAVQFPEIKQATKNFQPAKSFTEKFHKAEITPPEPIVLTAEQEKTYAALRN